MVLHNKAPVLLVSTLLVLIFPKHVHAYIDPGTGSYIFQVILAGILGGLFAIKLYWKKITSVFLRLFNRSKEQKDKEDVESS